MLTCDVTDDPSVAKAISVVVEHGVSGSSTGAPIARDLLAHALRYDPGARKAFVPKARDVASADGTAQPT